MNNKALLIFASVLLLFPTLAWSKGGIIQFSKPQSLGDGEIRVFGTVIGRYPVSVGILFDGGVFSNAPTTESDGKWDILDAAGNVTWYCCGHELDFDVPDNVRRATAFEHIVVNWNPQGHPPPTGIYRPPHFDFHFYTISREERYAIEAPTAEEMCAVDIPLSCENFDLAMQPLPADMMPPQHTSVGAVEPAMGNHLLDLSSPEFNGELFTHTWIFGTWKGALSFWEPMITQDFLLSAPNAYYDVTLPAAAPEAGFYPSKYGIFYLQQPDLYMVVLSGFVWLPESAGL
ncbi:MAG: hypothetical protein CSH49_07750 [Alcanivorax sp.]|nr:MAG: hypothetical protein CSH49_07750 [Alcanivorax sp.]